MQSHNKPISSTSDHFFSTSKSSYSLKRMQIHGVKPDGANWYERKTKNSTMRIIHKEADLAVFQSIKANWGAILKDNGVLSQRLMLGEKEQ